MTQFYLKSKEAPVKRHLFLKFKNIWQLSEWIVIIMFVFAGFCLNWAAQPSGSGFDIILVITYKIQQRLGILQMALDVLIYLKK